MSRECSPAFALIVNLAEAAKWHQENCSDSENCAVSLRLLTQAACMMLGSVLRDERAEALSIVEKMPEYYGGANGD